MAELEVKRENRFSTRKNASAKPKYSEQTKTVAFRCPLSKLDELKIIVKSKINYLTGQHPQLPNFFNLLKTNNKWKRISPTYNLNGHLKAFRITSQQLCF